MCSLSFCHYFAFHHRPSFLWATSLCCFYLSQTEPGHMVRKKKKISVYWRVSTHWLVYPRRQQPCGCRPLLKIWLFSLQDMKSFENLAQYLDALNTQCWAKAQLTKRSAWGQRCIGQERTLCVNEPRSLLLQAAVLGILIENWACSSINIAEHWSCP